MLSFLGNSDRYCDGVSRREFLQIGGIAATGLTLPQLLRAESQAPQAKRKSIINIFLSGGPTHIDTFDLKPNAPVEYRGEFTPIATNVSGVGICELMPGLATVADRYTVVRSVTGMNNEHTSVQSDSGWSVRSLDTMGGRPGIGSVMSKLWGPAQVTEHGTAPTNVDVSNRSLPGFLGQVHAAYRPDSIGRRNLQLNSSISMSRLDDRQGLLSGLDRLQRDIDRTGMMTAIDSFTDRAVGIITSGEISKALNNDMEDPRVRNRYGKSGGAFLTARRLIDAGVRCVSIAYGSWDTHGNNFATMRRQLPGLSQALTTLIEDLDARGKLDDTIIMMSGEFGRTPRINGNAGRDHWPRSAFFFLGGGGFRHQGAIGTTNSRGEVAQDRPIHLQDIFTTVYKQMGIDPETTTLTDPNGRPQYLTDHRDLIHEII
ncbi:MAG: hypothetical protein CMJ78_22515 [Planctomycetaceae bacterium]|nr:hypothetical protein [Planctomycetaceae bacterium]